VAGCLRQPDVITDKIGQLERLLAGDALSDEDALRLMTLPGVGAVTAIGLLAAIGDIRRSPTPAAPGRLPRPRSECAPVR